MSEFLETTHDKFIFRVKTGLYYSEDDFWAEVQGDQAVVGLSDYLQKVSGDVAFLETVPLNKNIRQGDAAGTVETMKSVVDLTMPVSGKIIEINPEIENKPEFINQDPYGTGWIYRIQLSAWPDDKNALHTAESYMELMKEKIAKDGK